jgi:FkbM family methyltransferase
MIRHLLWRLLSLSITYPVASPALLAYALRNDQRYLDFLYSIRSLTHGIPLRGGLRFFKSNGVKLIFPSREDPNFEDVFLREVYFPYKPRKEDVVFDVGAHMGFFAVKTAKKVKEVVAFEPDPRNYSFLLKNVKENCLGNVTTLNYAVGIENNTLFLKRSYGQGRTSVTNINTGHKVTVRSIDSIASTLGLKPSVIKIDTEGFEVPILKGAEKIIDRDKPKLLIASYHYPSEAQEVINHLSARNYLCYRYDIPYTLQMNKEAYIYAEYNKKRSKNDK